MSRFRPAYALIALALAICAGWHFLLFRFAPTDGFTGTGNIQAGQFELRYAAPPETAWADGGISTYTKIFRADARSVTDWLNRSLNAPSAWVEGQEHQYLVDRRDGDGKRVIHSTLFLPSTPFLYLGIPSLVALISLIAVLIIGQRYAQAPMFIPLTLLICGT